MKIDDTIEATKLIIAGAEALVGAIDKVRAAFTTALPDIKAKLAEMEAAKTQLGHDRADADTELDKKFGP